MDNLGVKSSHFHSIKQKSRKESSEENQTSIRKRLVGKTIPAPTEVLNVSNNSGALKFLNSFSVSFAIFPAQANTCPWIPLSLNHLTGKSNERSANAVTAASPPTKSLSSLPLLFGSLGPSPLVLNPHSADGPPKEHTGDEFPPKKNLSGTEAARFWYPLPHGKVTPPDTPKFRAAW